MTELELLAELLSEKDCNRFLKEYNEKVPGYTRNRKPSLDEKRKHLVKVFKKQTPNMSRLIRGGTEDPYVFALRSLAGSLREEVSEEDFFHEMCDALELDDAQKLARAIYHYPEDFREWFPKLLENHLQGKRLFDFEQPHRTEEEAMDYFRKTIRFGGDGGLEDLYEVIKEMHSSEEQDVIEELEAQFSPLSLGAFMVEMKKFRDEHEMEFLYFIYGLAHQGQLDSDLAYVIAAHAVLRLKRKQDGVLMELANELKSRIRSQDQLEEKAEKAQSLSKTLKAAQKDLKDARKKQGALEKEIRLFSQREKADQQQLAQWESRLQEHQQDTEKQKKFWASALQNQEEQTKLWQNRCEEMRKAIQEVAGTQDSEEAAVSFAVIHYTEMPEVLASLFQEVPLLHVSEWTAQKEKILGPGRGKIYVQRDGLSTRSIQEIRQFARMHQMETEVFFARSPKELIESIAHFKYAERGN